MDFMKKIIFTLVLFLSVLVTSCTTVNKTATVADVEKSVNTYPVIADLQVSPEKVEKTYTWSFRPFHIGEPKIKDLKQNLVAELLLENNADVLVEMHYVYSKTQFGTRSMTVFGFPAKMKNFHNATKDELEAIKGTTYVEVERPAGSAKNKKGGFLGFIKKLVFW